MKNRLILQQHAPFADIIGRGLDFCDTMLKISEVMYPFAVVAENHHFNCLFVPNSQQLATPLMIEELHAQLELHQKMAGNCATLLVYPATVTHPKGSETSALVFTMYNTQGHNTVTIYPYTHASSGIEIGRPYTCDFSD